MFHDLPEGQTHYQNDGCGCPEHNQKEAWGIIESFIIQRPQSLAEAMENCKKAKVIFNQSLQKAREEERQKIKAELLKIADDGELEELRSNVERYFNEL